jgi:hypothetical protein
MKNFSVEEIIEAVRTKLDEIGLNESEMMASESDNVNLDSVIESCIGNAYRYVSLQADVQMLEGKILASPGMTIGTDLVAKMMLPTDFLRLVGIRLSSWKTSVNRLVEEHSPEYMMQSNRFLCGTPERPVAALVHTMTGKQIELYKAASEKDSLKSFVYIPSLPDGFGSVEISDQTADAFIYYIAALTLVTFREEAAANFMSVARNLLGLE